MNKPSVSAGVVAGVAWEPRRLVRPPSLFALPVCRSRGPATGWRG